MKRLLVSCAAAISAVSGDELSNAVCVLRDVTGCSGNSHRFVGGWDATQAWIWRLNSDAGSFESAPAVADIDADGDLDLVLGDNDGGLNYYRNVGSGAVPAYEAVDGGANPFDGLSVGAFSKPVFGDVDGDGDLDLVVGDYYGALFYFRNDGSAASPSCRRTSATTSSPCSRCSRTGRPQRR